MRVLFSSCAFAGQTPGGGDQVQMRQTAKALANLDVDVVIDNSPEPDPAGYDLVHLFNLQHYPGVTQRMEYLARQRDKGLRFSVVMSPIFWDQAELSWAAQALDAVFSQMRQNGTQRELHLNELAHRDLSINGQKWHARLPYGHPWSTTQKTLLEAMDMVLVSSAAELQCLQHSLFTTRFRHHFVTNAVDPDRVRYAETAHSSYSPPYEQYALFAGRWADVRKNMLMLCEALQGAAIPLVIAGPGGHEEREPLVKSWLPEATYMLGSLAHEAMGPVYQHARVFVMPSWYETPGLASLEAAAYGNATLVVGNRAAEPEYFREDVYYCDPGNVQSIRGAVELAWENWEQDAPRRQRLAKRVLACHTWDVASKQTLAAYNEVVHG